MRGTLATRVLLWNVTFSPPRWNPTQSVRTILLSVQSLLNEPNTSSAANVDASVMYRKWKEGKKGSQEYARILEEQVELSRQEAEKDNVKVPLRSLGYTPYLG